MWRACGVVWIMAVGLFGSFAARESLGQEIAGNSLPEPTKKIEAGTLKLSLRLEDETPFLGAASVRVLPERGYELLGARDQATGDVWYYAVPAGKYVLDVNAAGFAPVRMTTELEGRGSEKTLVLVMKRKVSEEDIPVPAAVKTPEKEIAAKVEPDKVTSRTWKPVEWGDSGLPLERNVACPLEQILGTAGERVREFIGSMEKFTATETVEHYPVEKSGERRGPERRKFEYVVVVARNAQGTFWLEEFRNGHVDPEQFPAKIATMGLPAVVLVFHPDYQQDFRFSCEGLAHEAQRDVWQVRFAQREDRPVRIESYVVNGASFGIRLEGRAWIDAGKGQVVRLESQLLKPIPEIELWEQHQNIKYTGVKFAATGQEIWLPQSAEVSVERRGKRYYRRHTFSDFRLFNVDTAQNVKAPSKGSYSFTNLTDREMTGELTVTPVDGLKGGPIILRFAVPAHGRVVKMVGPGKDVSLPVAQVGSAKFVYSGDAGSVKVDVDLVRETMLDVVPAGTQQNP